MPGQLEDYLNSLRFATEQFGEIKARNEATDKAKRLRELGSNLPDMIRQGQGLEVAGQAMDLNPQLAMQLIKQQGTGAESGLSPELLGQLNPGGLLSETQIGALSNMPRKEALKLVPQLATAAGGVESRAGQAVERSRRGRAEVQAPLAKTLEKMNKFESTVADLDKTYKNVDSALKKGTLPGDAVVFNFLARNVAGEKGPLSDSDISRFVARAFQGDAQKFENFMSGQSTSVLTNEQKKAFYDLIGTARDGYEGWKKSTVTNILGNAVLQPELTQGGTPHKALEAKAKKYGVEFNFDKETGTYGAQTKTIKKEKIDQNAGGLESNVKSLIQKIDPADQAEAQSIVDGYMQAGKPVPASFIEELKALGKGK